MRLFGCAVLALLSSCSEFFFSSDSWPDRSRPVALIETIGGVELGATTEYGILLLGRTATEGPCRVRYFLGPTPMTDDGELETTPATFTRAEIDLKTQAVRVFDRQPTPADPLLAMWTTDGVTIHEVEVELARGDHLEGDVLLHPGEELPIGASIVTNDDDGTHFVGLVAGRATLDNGPGRGTYFVFAGVNRVRELLAIPEKYPVDYVPKYRPDGITVLKPIK